VITLSAAKRFEAATEAARRGLSGGKVYDLLTLKCAMKASAERVYALNLAEFTRLAPLCGFANALNDMECSDHVPFFSAAISRMALQFSHVRLDDDVGKITPGRAMYARKRPVLPAHPLRTIRLAASSFRYPFIPTPGFSITSGLDHIRCE
jgi:hypothetical protein